MQKMLKPAIILLLVLCVYSGYSQDIPFRLMFYNVENLFDISDDPHTEDNDFLPGGVMRWNYTRYNKKINSLYKTIIAAGEWSPPGIIGLCENENRKVLEDLLTGTNLLKFDYGILHEESPDERGIDVSLLYRKDLVSILFSGYYLPSINGNVVTGTRKVLYAKCLVGKDTVHIFVNHWPSRRGGVLAGEQNRMAIAAMVRQKVDSIGASFSGSKIIITGDFNCTPDDPVMKRLTSTTVCNLINLSEKVSDTGQGTYRFSGTWEVIDQIIVSESLLNCKSGLSADMNSLRIFNPEFLLTDDPKFPGSRPYSTYSGYRYQGGFSDHLPVLLDLSFR